MAQIKPVILPKQLNIASSQNIVAAYRESLDADGAVMFDFSNVTWTEPFGLTVLAAAIHRCIDDGKKVYYAPPQDASLMKYLEDIGFDNLFLKGKKVFCRSTSLALKRFDALDPGYIDSLVSLVEDAMRLGEVERDHVRFYINELLTNGLDHSQSPIGCYVCAQWHPKINEIRISVTDAGMGIKTSLNRSGRYGSLKTDEAAILKAIEEGVTTRKRNYGGLGLSNVKKFLALNQGTLTIMSGTSKINFYYNKIERKTHACAVDGTIVDIRMFRGKTLAPKARAFFS